MSIIDIQIQNQCDHRVTGERLLLAADGLTMIPQFPVANVGSISLSREGNTVPVSAYSVATNPSLSGDVNYKKLKLAVKDPSLDPYFEVNYNTFVSYCPKCSGSGYTDDITDDGAGDLSVITSSGLLAQSVEKVIVTKIRSNKYSVWVGTSLHDLVGSKISNFSTISTEIKNDIRAALGNLQRYQVEQMQLNNKVDPTEVFGSILSIDVNQNSADPTIVEVLVRYTSRSGKVSDYTQLLQLSNFRFRG